MRSKDTKTRVKWSIHEVALLFDLFLKTKDSNSYDRSSKILLFSNHLREHAYNNDLDISESYRNYNGINMRLQNVAFLFSNGKKGLSSYSSLDKKVYDMYMDNKNSYKDVLNEAKEIYDTVINDCEANKNAFLNWLVSNRNLNVSLAEAYVKYLGIITDNNCFNYDIDSVFSICTSAQLEIFIEYLKTNDEFTLANIKTYSSIDKALKLYLKYLDINMDYISNDSRIINTTNRLDDLDNDIAYNNDLNMVDFNNISNYKYTNPKYFIFSNRSHEVKNWTDLYIKFCNLLLALKEIEFISIIPSNKSYFNIDKTGMIAPKRLSNNLYAETNFSATKICKNCRTLLKHFGLSTSKLVIYYTTRNSSKLNTENKKRKKVNASYYKNNPNEAKNENVKQIKEVMNESFKTGFRLNSTLELKKLKRLYKEKHNDELRLKDENILSTINRLCIISGKKAYLSDTMLSANARDSVLDYIHGCFNNAALVVYYSTILDRFEKEFISSNIYNPAMLMSYLSHFDNGELCFKKSYIVSRFHANATPYDSVRAFAKNWGAIVTYTDFERYHECIPINEIKHILGTNREFVFIERGHYIHIDNVYFSENDIGSIRTLLNNHITEYGYISGNELISLLKKRIPDFLEKNEEISYSIAGIRDSIKYHFENEFSFRGNLISMRNSNLSLSIIYASFCRRQSSGFTINQLYSLREELGSNIYFDSVYENSLRINQNEFVPKNEANFDVTAVDDAINGFCSGDYISLKQIDQFASFPGADFPWNSFLLEHYVFSYSKEFRLIHAATFNATKCAGVIVRSTSGYTTFDDIIIDALSRLDLVLTKKNALNYLYENGYIARRKLSEIDRIIKSATRIQSMKG